MITLDKLTRFFPYESIHTSSPVIKITDTNHEWRNALKSFLNKYKVDEYIDCSEGYFNLKLDNKITLELTRSGSPIYLTYWDNNIYISDAFHSFDKNKIPHCTVTKK